MADETRTRFIIIGMQRSGTTVTHVAMYGHPNICSMIDEFTVSPFFTDGIASFTVGGKNAWEREHGYAQFFDAVTIFDAKGSEYAPKAYSGLPDNPKGEILSNGMKIAVPTAEDARNLSKSLVEFFPDMKVIYVHRDGWLEQFASLKRAQKSGTWHSWKDKENKGSSEPIKFEIDAAEFEAYIQMAMETEEAFSSLRATHPVCDVHYETDIATGLVDTAYRVFDFVGVPRVEPAWVNMSKVSPPIEDFVVNHQEMRDLLEQRRSGSRG